MPSQPRNLKAVAVSPTAIQLNWTRPLDPAEVVTGYELYWNDTFTQQQEHRGLPGDSQSFLLDSLQPDTVYYLWLAARSRDGEGAATPPLPVRTDQYGERALFSRPAFSRFETRERRFGAYSTRTPSCLPISGALLFLRFLNAGAFLC